MNANPPLISIVMPVKDAGLYLKECLDSIINQTEDHWELIAINDSSSDDSKSILNNYQLKDNRIKTYDNQGNGIIDALKTAYKYSQGQLIHRMDADDIMVEQKLASLKSSLLNAGIGHIVTAKVKYFAEGGVSEGFLKYEEWINTLCDKNNFWDEIYKECVISSPCWLIYREDFDRCGGFNSNIYPEDYDLVFRFYKHKMKVVAVDKVLHLWRDHSERSSRNHSHYKINSFLEIKLRYFLLEDRINERPLVLWGAGKKGKTMSRLLKAQNIDFSWVSNNPNKHGKEIYQQIMLSFESILSMDNPQIIITVAQKNAKEEIIHYLKKKSLIANKDYWFFS